MEHWQFLIQRQGDRSWHILESPNLQILAGHYRVLARSSLLNTDVEVRVTHFSTHEATPKRRIFKRSRRTNSEGLMAVIPFTDFEPGVWQLRCSGDLMSDMLGKSWQYSIEVQVVCQEADNQGSREAEEQEPIGEVTPSLFPIPVTNVPQALQTPDLAIATSAELPIPTDNSPDIDVVPNVTQETFVPNLTGFEDTSVALDVTQAEDTASNTDTVFVPYLTGFEDTAIALDVTQTENTASNAVTEFVPDLTGFEDTAVALDVTQTENTASNADTEFLLDFTQPEYTVNNTDIEIVLDVTQEEYTTSTTDTITAQDITQAEHISSNTDISILSDVTLEEYTTSNTGMVFVLEDITTEEDIYSITNTTIVPDTTKEHILNSTETDIVTDVTNEENIGSDRPVSPVWFKGETVEQILQNLIELALPAPEPLTEEENVMDSSETQQLPPLLLTLDRDTYIARWGQALTINGYVELEEKTNSELAETLSPKIVRGLELKIELRSPLESQILTQVVQPLPDQELPFNINTYIDIPAECESKLILADIILYGKFTDTSEVTHLANQSFTITADVTELLTITAAAKSSTSSNKVIAPSVSSSDSTEPEPTFKLDLKLLNLVKVRKTDQPLVGNPSPNTPLPAQINLQLLREATRRTSEQKISATSPQLPKLPPIQIDVNTPTDVVAESPLQNELLEKDATIAAINLEQLVIRQRRIPIIDTTFPYLKRLPTVSTATEEVKDNTPDTLGIVATDDTSQLDAIIDEDKNTAQTSVDTNLEVQEESVAQIPVDTNLEVQEEFVPQIPPQANSQLQEQFVPPTPPQANSQLQEQSLPQITIQTNSEFIKTKLYSSPLLRKWMHSQGYSFPEPINELPPQDHDNYVSDEQASLPVSAEIPNSDVDAVDVNLLSSVDANTEILEDTNTVEKVDLVIEENTEVETVLEEPTFSPPLLSQIPPPPPINGNTASVWLSEEIVVDDTYSDLETDTTKSYALEEEEQASPDLSSLLAINIEALEPLPIPQLYVPEGELIAGKSVIIRVVMPEVSRPVAIKLWLEDCQTRWLLDGPHLLTNLLPNTLGGLEVMTQLNIPFGCLEIRLEAIALDPATQQESHKVTIVRTVIPPDLPNLELDELLGI